MIGSYQFSLLVQQMCYSKECGNYSVNIDDHGMIFVFCEMYRHW